MYVAQVMKTVGNIYGHPLLNNLAKKRTKWSHPSVKEAKSHQANLDFIKQAAVKCLNTIKARVRIHRYLKETDKNLLKKYIPSLFKTSWFKNSNISIVSSPTEVWIDDFIFQGNKMLGHVKRHQNGQIFEIIIPNPEPKIKSFNMNFIIDHKKIHDKSISLIRLKAIHKDDGSKDIIYFKDNGEIGNIHHYDKRNYYISSSQPEPIKVEETKRVSLKKLNLAYLFK